MASIKPTNTSSCRAQDTQRNRSCHFCTQNDNGPNEDTDFDDGDSQPSLITTLSESSYSDDSDSTFQIALDDDEIETAIRCTAICHQLMHIQSQTNNRIRTTTMMVEM